MASTYINIPNKVILAVNPTIDIGTVDQGTPNTLSNAWPVKPTDGTNSQSYTGVGEAKVSVTQPLPAGSNAIGSVSVSNFPATQPVSGTVTANQGGTWTTGRTWNLLNTTDSVNVGNFPALQPVSGTVTALQGTSPWVVSGTVNAVQSGSWNILNITGTVSLPTGASTEATLSALSAKFNSLGQKTMAASTPVVISSDQSPVTVTGSVTTSPNVNIHDAAGNSLTSQVNGSQRALDVGINVSGVQIDPRQIRALTLSDTVTAVQPTGANLHTVVDSGTITATQGTSPWVVSGTVTANQGSPPWSVSQSGAWTTGRTWNLLNTTDSVNVGNFPATQPVSGTVAVSNLPTTVDTNYGTVGASTLRSAAQIGNTTGPAAFNAGTTTAQTLRVVLPTDQTSIPVTQSTSPWVVSGTVTANAGTGNFTVVQPTGTNLHTVVDSGTIAATQSGTWNITNISGTVSLPTGAATSANQTTANTSLASIDSKLTAPLSVTLTENTGPWYANGFVATAALTQTTVMSTGFTYTGSNTSVFIASGSANDTLAGTGAQKITITYFKADGSGPFTETRNMQGTTGFFSTNTMAFIQSAVVSQVGSGGTNDGAINLANLSPLSTMANIAVGANETFYCHHFVPLGKTAYITNFSFGSTTTAAAQGARFTVRKRAIPLANSAPLSTMGSVTLVGTSSTQNITFPEPITVTGPAVIFTELVPDSATANTFYAAIGGYEQ